MLIKKAKLSDWKVIQKLNNQVFQSDSENDDDLNLDWPFSKEGIKCYKELSDGTYGHCLIAWEEDTPVGYIALSEKDFGYRKSKYVEVENIGVDPKFRSKGIGRKLMLEAEKWAKKKNATKMYVATFYLNKKVHKFYKSLGYYEMGLEFDKKLV